MTASTPSHGAGQPHLALAETPPAPDLVGKRAGFYSLKYDATPAELLPHKPRHRRPVPVSDPSGQPFRLDRA